MFEFILVFKFIYDQTMLKNINGIFDFEIDRYKASLGLYTNKILSSREFDQNYANSRNLNNNATNNL